MFRTDVWTLDTRKSPHTRAFETNADRLGPGETVTLTVLWSSGLDTPSLESVVFQRISPVTQEPTEEKYYPDTITFDPKTLRMTARVYFPPTDARSGTYLVKLALTRAGSPIDGAPRTAAFAYESGSIVGWDSHLPDTYLVRLDLVKPVVFRETVPARAWEHERWNNAPTHWAESGVTARGEAA